MGRVFYFYIPNGSTQEIHRVLCPGGIMEAMEEGMVWTGHFHLG